MSEAAHTSDGKARSNSEDTGGEGVIGKELFEYVLRIERLEEEKQTIADDIKDVYGEAKGRGYDTKIIKKVIARRKRDKNEVLEEDAIFDVYWSAIERLMSGNLPGTSA